MLQAGIRGRSETIVTEEKTARVMGSGELDVFATPAILIWLGLSPFLYHCQKFDIYFLNYFSL